MAKKPTLNFGDAMGSMFTAAAMAQSEKPRESLLDESSKAERTGERVTFLRREVLIPNKNNKTVYDVEDLHVLAADIKRRGIQTPLLVRQRPDGKYVITSGHRRFAANEIAVNELGYEAGNYIPTIIRANVSDAIAEREALILDNLQRDKTDFNRMMEIEEMKACALDRRERGEDIPNIRDYIIERLGVTTSEITRFDKIYTTLIPELMQQFRRQRFATNVAYTIATSASDKAQAYIVKHWDWERTDSDGRPVVLTYPEMEKLLVASTAPAAGKIREKAPGGKKVRFSTVEESFSALDQSLSALRSRLGGIGTLKRVEQRRILNRAGKIYLELDSLKEELDALGIGQSEGTGNG